MLNQLLSMMNSMQQQNPGGMLVQNRPPNPFPGQQTTRVFRQAAPADYAGILAHLNGMRMPGSFQSGSINPNAVSDMAARYGGGLRPGPVNPAGVNEMSQMAALRQALAQMLGGHTAPPAGIIY